MNSIVESTITGPDCGHQKQEIMLGNACQYFYECEQCKTTLKSKAHDCCVFCSYRDVPCPSIQEKNNCCKK